MTAITEDYVSFETAKLLKEKGFDTPCENQYINCSSGHPFLTDVRDNAGCYYKNSEIGQDEYSAPTLQMARKWLRNNFNLEIYPFHDAIQENNNWWYRIEQHSKGCSLTKYESDVIYKAYEEAAEAAIKYCLENLI